MCGFLIEIFKIYFLKKNPYRFTSAIYALSEHLGNFTHQKINVHLILIHLYLLMRAITQERSIIYTTIRVEIFATTKK